MKVLGRKKRDRYFELSLSLHRKKRRKNRGSSLPDGTSENGHDIIWEMVFLSLFLVLYMWISFTFETLFTSVKLFNTLATLGGLETYDQTVIGLTIIFFLGGCAYIFGVFDD